MVSSFSSLSVLARSVGVSWATKRRALGSGPVEVEDAGGPLRQRPRLAAGGIHEPELIFGFVRRMRLRRGVGAEKGEMLAVRRPARTVAISGPAREDGFSSAGQIQAHQIARLPRRGPCREHDGPRRPNGHPVTTGCHESIRRVSHRRWSRRGLAAARGDMRTRKRVSVNSGVSMGVTPVARHPNPSAHYDGVSDADCLLTPCVHACSRRGQMLNRSHCAAAFSIWSSPGDFESKFFVDRHQIDRLVLILEHHLADWRCCAGS